MTEPIWLEEPRGGFPDPAIIGLSGLEQMRSFARGHSPPPPLAHLIGTRPVEVGGDPEKIEPGRVDFAMPVTRWLLSPVGLPAIGALAIVADGALGCSVQTMLPAATPYTTSELSITALRPLAVDTTVLARGRAVHSGRSLALSEVRLEDEEGRLLAFGTSRCVVFPTIDPPPDPPAEPRVVEPPHYETPDPYLREPLGETIAQETWDRMSGLEILQAQIAGELPAPPIHHLTGLTFAGAEEGSAELRLPCSPWLCSPLRTVQGGFTAMAADAALQSAIQTTVPAGTAYAAVDLKVNFLRPVQPDGRDLVARGSVIHRGRTTAIAQSEVLNADGKRVALATGSAAILPGRPADLGGRELSLA